MPCRSRTDLNNNISPRKRATSASSSTTLVLVGLHIAQRPSSMRSFSCFRPSVRSAAAAAARVILLLVLFDRSCIALVARARSHGLFACRGLSSVVPRSRRFQSDASGEHLRRLFELRCLCGESDEVRGNNSRTSFEDGVKVPVMVTCESAVNISSSVEPSILCGGAVAGD